MKSLFESIRTESCPNCRSGKMFESGPYDHRRFAKMNANCGTCGQNFDPEPGFYTGAMYVSYGFQVAIIAFTQLLFFFLAPEAAVWIRIGAVAVVVLLAFPVLFRLSRVIWLHLFVSYHSRKLAKS